MFDRPSDPVWTQCLAAVEPVLAQIGFRLAAESAHHASFGSASVEYERADRRLCLVWDGREHWIDAKVARLVEPHRWSPLEPLAVAPPPTNPKAHVLRPGVVATEYIANLTAAIRAWTGASR